MSVDRPNIVFILMDNIGFGEPGCYGGGILRGAATPRIDGLATEGLRLLNYNVEAQCTASRSALMTGRYPIRSGTHTLPIDLTRDGLTQWEVTIAEVLSDRGYATGHFGKWHLGSEEGRFPTNQGFDEWYGVPRTTDESLWHDQPGYDANEFRPTYIMEGRKGEPTRQIELYTGKNRPLIDTEITRRAFDFVRRSVEADKPFYCYVPYTLIHYPTWPHPDFKGKTGNGDFPDCLAEMDAHVGEWLDLLDELGIADDTIFVFTSDNGPEWQIEWQGSPGPWRGTYFTVLESSLRVPFIIRWPGNVPAGAVSNEIVHEVDTYTTLASLAGGQIPTDRPIDGVDQSDFFLGRQEKSNREGFVAYCGPRLQAVKWRNWKVHFYDPEHQTAMKTGEKLPLPQIYNLYRDPHERNYIAWTHYWVLHPSMKFVFDHEESLKQFPPIPAGTPDPYQPPA
jgi:arylsulfatase A-like enzyme